MIPTTALDKGSFVEIDRGTARHIIDLTEKGIDVADAEFEFDAMRALLDYYAQVRDGDGRVLLLVETGRTLRREQSGDKSGVSILGGSKIRDLIRNSQRSRPALVLLR